MVLTVSLMLFDSRCTTATTTTTTTTTTIENIDQAYDDDIVTTLYMCCLILYTQSVNGDESDVEMASTEILKWTENSSFA